MKLGVQLFGAMDLYRRDPQGFLRQVKDMGYDLVEPCVSFGLDLPFAWQGEELGETVAMVRAAGLGLSSAHVFAADLRAAVPRMLEAAGTYRVRAYVAGIRDTDKAALDRFAAVCGEVAEALAPHGVELWLHNNAAEIRTRVEGLSAYEYVLRACGGRLGAQVDTGWVACGGEDVNVFLDRNEKFIRAIHHKDVAALSQQPVNTALGAGVVPPEYPYKFAEARGLLQIVDQDNSAGDLAEDLRRSAAYLRELEEKRG